MKNTFSPGQPVVVREIWQGKIWTACPEIVVQDTPDLLALYIPGCTRWKQARSLDDSKVTVKARRTGEWQLADAVWHGEGRLRLTIPGKPYSVLVFWNERHNALAYWYVNLEDPLIRTDKGFDYMDQLLDILIEPDLQTWHWKDEDEFQEAQKSGLISAAQAKLFRCEGENARKLIQSGKSIYNRWGNWKPDHNWQAQVLPAGWDVV